MSYAIITSSIANLYLEPSWDSTVKVQLLFGEAVNLLKQRDNWIHIEQNNLTSGWVPKQQLLEISQKQFQQIQSEPATFCFDIYANAISSNEHIPLIYGSKLPHFDGLSFKLNKQKIVFNGQVFSKPEELNLEVIKRIALKYVNSPFLKGGRTPFGIDSVGLVQMIYRFLDIELPNSIDQLLYFGRDIAFYNSLAIGDLVFFTIEQQTQVGVYLGDEQLLHCYGVTQLGQLDSHGLLDYATRTYLGTNLKFRRIIVT